MDGEWVNTGSDDQPRFEHVHADETRHKCDRTIPFLRDETPRFYRPKYICQHCRADLERPWPAEE